MKLMQSRLTRFSLLAGPIVWLVILVTQPASTIAQNKTEKIMTPELQSLTDLVAAHFNILNTRDSSVRLTRMKDIYSNDFHILDTHFEHFGHKDFNASISQIHKMFPDDRFSITGDIKTLRDVVKVKWRLGDKVSGEDVLLFKEGKIHTILAFVDPVKN